LGPIPNPQSPIPNPQSPLQERVYFNYIIYLLIKYLYKKIKNGN